MTRRQHPDDALLDAFLAEALDDEALDGATLDALGALVDDLTPVAPPAALRDRILAAAVPTGRLRRFADALARMLDVAVSRAEELLDTFESLPGWEDGPLPGCSRSLWVDGGAATLGCIRGFIRLDPGVTFPEHRHLGEEQVLVLQGSFVDSVTGATARPGDLIALPAGTSHAFTVAAEGPPLLYFVVVREGVELGGVAVRHRDDPPR